MYRYRQNLPIFIALKSLLYEKHKTILMYQRGGNSIDKKENDCFINYIYFSDYSNIYSFC